MNFVEIEKQLARKAKAKGDTLLPGDPLRAAAPVGH